MGWTYEFDNDVGPDDEYYIEFFSVYDKEHNRIGQFDEESDARLAAAAPYMLDALIEIYNLRTIGKKADEDCSIVVEHLARKAIALASGE